MEGDDKPFACSHSGCTMRFGTVDHLNVHIMKHQMSLCLGTDGGGKTPNKLLFVDQTPTPTKFLRNCEEIGLFTELNSKNPFEEAFKKAAAGQGEVSTPTSQAVTSGLASPGILHTPTPANQAAALSSAQPEYVLLSDTLEQKIIKKVPKVESVEIVHSSPIQEKIEIVPFKEESEPVTVTHVLAPQSVILPEKSEDASMHDDDVEIIEEEEITVSESEHSQDSQISVQVTSPSQASNVGVQNVVVGQGQTSVPVGNLIVAKQPQYMVQVQLQLPDGRKIPVQMPATFSASPSPALAPKVQNLAPATSPRATVAQVRPAVPAPTEVSSTSIAKQRLKATLQQNHAAPASLPPRKIRISSSDMVPANTATSSNILINPTASTSPRVGQSFLVKSPPIKVETQAADTTALVINRKRKSEEEDSDERRKKFLERNRAAAARCRNKRKNWVTNLEKKADDLNALNTNMQTEINMLRAEVASLKTLLLAHKDCPITLAQRNAGQIQFTTGPGQEFDINTSPELGGVVKDTIVITSPGFALADVVEIKEEGS